VRRACVLERQFMRDAHAEAALRAARSHEDARDKVGVAAASPRGAVAEVLLALSRSHRPCTCGTLNIFSTCGTSKLPLLCSCSLYPP
jgi:hypothetical protein